MGKKKSLSRKDLIKRSLGFQHQYNQHQNKIKENPSSFSMDHWKKEKEHFLSLINYYLAKAKGNTP